MLDHGCIPLSSHRSQWVCLRIDPHLADYAFPYSGSSCPQAFVRRVYPDKPVTSALESTLPRTPNRRDGSRRFTPADSNDGPPTLVPCNPATPLLNSNEVQQHQHVALAFRCQIASDRLPPKCSRSVGPAQRNVDRAPIHERDRCSLNVKTRQRFRTDSNDGPHRLVDCEHRHFGNHSRPFGNASTTLRERFNRSSRNLDATLRERPSDATRPLSLLQSLPSPF